MFFHCALIVLFTSVHAKVQLTEEDGVAVLTKSDFNETVNEYNLTLVMFYASWCGHCQALKPEYVKVASQLKSELPNVLVAKVDAIAESELASEHGVKGYPTLRLHKGGAWIDYSGDRKAEAIIGWVTRKSGPSITVLRTVQEVEDFTKSENSIVAFVKEGHQEIESVYQEVADSLDQFSFGLANSAEILEKYGVKKNAQISVFKSYDEGRADYTEDVNVANLTLFILTETIPEIVEFTQESASAVFSSPIRMHFVAFIPRSADYDKLVATMRPVAKNFKRKVHFIVIDTDVEDHQRIMDFFGMTKKDLPGYRLIRLSEDMVKFQPDSSDFSEAAMSAFVAEVLSGTRKPFLMSQEIPPESSDPVRVLVGKNFNEVTKDKSKAVFVKLYAPWCGHCQQLAPIWTSLGEAFKDRKDIIIAKLDATVNEAEGLHVNSFPTLKYYPKDSDEVIDYSGERTLEALTKFVENEGKLVDQSGQGKEEPSKDEL